MDIFRKQLYLEVLPPSLMVFYITIYHNISGIHASELYVDGLDGWVGSLCGAIIRASLRDANNLTIRNFTFCGQISYAAANF